MGLLSLFKRKDTKISDRRIANLTHLQLSAFITEDFKERKLLFPRPEFFSFFLGGDIYNHLHFKYYPEVIGFRFSLQEPIHPDTAVIDLFLKFQSIIESLTFEQKEFLKQFGFLPRNKEGEFLGADDLEKYKAEHDEEIHQKKILNYVMKNRINKAMGQTTVKHGYF